MGQLVSAARASLKLNGVKVAYMSGVSVNQENTLFRADVLDQLESAEIAVVGHTCSFTVNLMKIDSNSAQSLGIETTNLDDLLGQPELTMEIYDRISDTVLYNMIGVVFEGGTANLNAKGVFEGTLNFQGRIGRGL